MMTLSKIKLLLESPSKRTELSVPELTEFLDILKQATLKPSKAQ